MQHKNKRVVTGQLPLAFTAKDESKELFCQLKQFNEAHRGRGLRSLRSLLSSVVNVPGWEAAKRVYALVNSSAPESVVPFARELLSQSYDSYDEQIINSQIAAFVKKYPFIGSDSVCTQNAMKKFLRGERRNRHLNALLRRRRLGTDVESPKPTDMPHNVIVGGHQGLGLDPSAHVARMRDYIKRVIGEKPPFSEVFDECRWGPGAAVGVSGQFTNFARKLLAEEWTVTPAAIPYVLSAAKRYPMFWNLIGLTKSYSVKHETSFVPHPDMLDEVEYVCVDPVEFDRRMLARMVVVQHNKIALVPKDADCHRTIASEPLMNQFLQLSVDSFMKKRLRRFGINLSDQSLNQEKAYQGSILGWLNSYCTIDLKNASGSIYTELVKELLPPEWFSFLNCLRAPSWCFKTEEPVKYHGFVSMGNGYCFPLETLIFASICSSAHGYCQTRQDFVVYGDDIIVRQNEALVVLEYLHYFGFEVNTDKSFFYGPFRESCGADWYDGKPVRPVYLDNPLESFQEMVRAHNAFARLPNKWAELLAHSCASWFPSFANKFVRPFEDITDEAIDGRHNTLPDPWHMRCKTYRTPAWYGVLFSAIPDKDIGRHADFRVAYRYAALSGGKSEVPFAMRRETLMRVGRFTHGGGLSQDLPHEAGLCDIALKRSRPSIRLSVAGWGSSNLR
jgi:hypothetical protein